MGLLKQHLADVCKWTDLPEQGAKLLAQDDRIEAITWPEDRVRLYIVNHLRHYDKPDFRHITSASSRAIDLGY